MIHASTLALIEEFWPDKHFPVQDGVDATERGFRRAIVAMVLVLQDDGVPTMMIHRALRVVEQQTR